MALQLGSTKIKEIYLGNTKIAQMYLGANKVYQATVPLPSNTVRVRTNDGNVPTRSSQTTYETATLVPGTTDIYDVYKSGTDFSYLLYMSTNVVEVLGANTTDITNMSRMFQGCKLLTTVPLFDTSKVTIMSHMFNGCLVLISAPLFDTSNVTDMRYMFYNCAVLTTVPLFNTSLVTNMGYMFMNCKDVESGALALYQQASTQTTPPSSHSRTFFNCGSNTVTGAAELAQIPSTWK